MKKKLLLTAILGFSICAVNVNAQRTAEKKVSGQYTIRNSDEFESPKSHQVNLPLCYPNGILQINTMNLESFNFQWFSKDLKIVKENTVNIQGKFHETASFWSFLKLKNKLYAVTREVFRDTETEGLTFLEIAPKELNVKGDAKNLFRSSDKVRMETPSGAAGGAIYFGASAGSMYDIYVSNDTTKFMCTYALKPKEKSDKKNSDIIGLQVFDENLVKLWGDEFEMPYTEAKMDNLGYTLTSTGKVCLLAKVYEGDTPKQGARDKTKPNYHFEVLVYEKGAKTPKIIEIKLDNYFNKEAYIYESLDNKITIAGFYGSSRGTGVNGAYLLSLDVDKAVISKINGGYYEIPTAFLETFLSERQKKKLEKKLEKDEDLDVELNGLKIRAIYSTPDGSTKIVSEIFYLREHMSSSSSSPGGSKAYDAVYKDVVVMNIKGGKLDWVQKIPKHQATVTYISPYGGGFNESILRGISINSIVIGNDLFVFWKDKPVNSTRPEGERPAVFNGVNGMLRACSFGPKGEMKYTDIVDVGPYDMHFDVRRFVAGGQNNIISTERRKKMNMLFAIDVK
ncbi:MAG: hypothetical protein JWO09_2610 [Bacteroidetes bacterium]|nr:hypothetical protein [Bacteroidota bacterium]